MNGLSWSGGTNGLAGPAAGTAGQIDNRLDRIGFLVELQANGLIWAMTAADTTFPLRGKQAVIQFDDRFANDHVQLVSS